MKGLKLYLTAIILKYLAKPCQFFYHLFLEVKGELTLSNLKMLDNKLLAKAILEDKYCCEADAELLNALFLTKESIHLFGNIKETISSVLGKNYLAGTLTQRGYQLCALLNDLQPNHVLISIDNQV